MTITGASGPISHSVALTLVVQDAPGALDSTFGTAGRVVLPLGATSNDLGARGIAAQNDGILVCGNVRTAQSTTAVALARLTSAGVLDANFGTAGSTLANRAGSTVDVCGAMSVLPSGSLAVGGFTLYSATSGAHAFLTARFTDAGAVDTTFGAGTGFAVTPFGTTDAKANSMVTQPDGKLVLGGFGGGAVARARDTTTGSLATTIGPSATGTVGSTVTKAGAVTSLALQSTGDLVAAVQFPTFLVFRYTPVGILDTAFGSGGQVALDVGGQGASSSNFVFVQPDDSIVVVGGATMSGGTQGIAVARFTGGGAVDPTFGASGSLVFSYPGGASVANAAARADDGAIVLAGESFFNGASAFTVARATAAGIVDPAFGTGGRVTFDSGGVAEAVALDSLGRIVVGGRFTDGARTSFVVYRLWP